MTGYGATVVNAGVSGGALTRLGVFNSIPGTTRMANLVREPNLTDVVILIGENDISDGVPEADILNGMSTLLAQAKQHHIQAWSDDPAASRRFPAVDDGNGAGQAGHQSGPALLIYDHAGRTLDRLGRVRALFG